MAKRPINTITGLQPSLYMALWYYSLTSSDQGMEGMLVRFEIGI